MESRPGDIIKKLIKHNENPVVAKRKQILYRQLELKALGYQKIEDLKDEKLRANLDKLITRNINAMLFNKQERVNRER